ncbi:unnamed protein product [Musa textilis]
MMENLIIFRGLCGFSVLSIDACRFVTSLFLLTMIVIIIIIISVFFFFSSSSLYACVRRCSI